MFHSIGTGLATRFRSVFFVALMFVTSCQGVGVDDQGRIDHFAAVVADDTYAAHIGRQVMRTGGNAVDAVVAMAFSASVSSPGRVSMASYGSCLLRNADEETVVKIDFGSTHPRINLPLLQALWSLHLRYGQVRWFDLLSPASLMAQRGVLTSSLLHQDLLYAQDALRDDNAGSYLFARDRDGVEEGSLIRQPLLGTFLQQIAELNGITSDDQNRWQGEDKALTRLRAQLSSHVPNASWVVSEQELRPIITIGDWAYYAPANRSLLAVRAIWQERQGEGPRNTPIDPYTWLEEQKEIQTQWSTFRETSQREGDIDGAYEKILSFVTGSSTTKAEKKQITYEETKEEKDYVFQFSAVDYFGLVVSCTASLGTPFGTTRMVEEGGYFLPSQEKETLDGPGQWMIIDEARNKFIGLFMAGDRRSVMPAARIMRELLFDLRPLIAGIREPRYVVDIETKELWHEGELDIKTRNDYLKQAYRLHRSESIGNVLGIFCPLGVPQDVKFSVCLAETDIRGNGNGYVRIEP